MKKGKQMKRYNIKLTKNQIESLGHAVNKDYYPNVKNSEIKRIMLSIRNQVRKQSERSKMFGEE